MILLHIMILQQQLIIMPNGGMLLLVYVPLPLVVMPLHLVVVREPLQLTQLQSVVAMVAMLIIILRKQRLQVRNQLQLGIMPKRVLKSLPRLVLVQLLWEKVHLQVAVRQLRGVTP